MQRTVESIAAVDLLQIYAYCLLPTHKPLQMLCGDWLAENAAIAGPFRRQLLVTTFYQQQVFCREQDAL